MTRKSIRPNLKLGFDIGVTEGTDSRPEISPRNWGKESENDTEYIRKNSNTLISGSISPVRHVNFIWGDA